MEYSNAQAIIKDIRQKKILPIYILHGEESLFIDQVIEVIESGILTDSEKAFNLSILYGKDVEFKQVLDHARQFPLMSEWRVVIVKEAQQLKDIDKLNTYFEHPSPQTLFALAYKDKKIDGRAKWFKDLKKNPHVAIYHSQKVRDYKLGAWLDHYLKEMGRKISPKANNLLCEYLGNDLKKLTNEIEKMELNIPEGQEITVDDIDRYVGISKEYNVFELLTAIGLRKTKKAFMIADNLSSNLQRNPLQMIAPAFFQFFQKVYITKLARYINDRQLADVLGVNPYFVREYKTAAENFSEVKLREIFQLIQDTDARAKGVNNRHTPPSEILMELVGTILVPEVQPSLTF